MMKNILRLCCCIFLFTSHEKPNAALILFDKKDAIVWLQKQTISGKLSGFQSGQLTVHHDETIFRINVNSDSTFSFTIILHDANNKIWLSAGNEVGIVSDTLRLTLGYHPLPVVRPDAVICGDKATLHASVIDNPFKTSLKFLWAADSQNPASCTIKNNTDSGATAEIPITEGIYRFNLLVIAGKDSTWFQTWIIRNKKKLHAFDITAEHAPWIDDAVIYQITPSRFVKNARYDDIAVKLPEIKELGINTIWLQPVFKTHRGGQGYDVVDYFSLRPDLGSEQQLRNLITTAKSLRMRVLFDFVPNHTSINHPYAQDCIKYGKASHYYNFYQRENDGVKYSSHYKKDKYGFIDYFWADLVNLNYNNPEVQQWMVEACKYWVRKLDIDGYRFDAVWGINARAPLFGNRLQAELKGIKPDLFLLAEDKASDEQVYASGFDAAYDWTPDTNWVSQWSWQQEFDSGTTTFNFPAVHKRGNMLRKALFHNSNPAYPVLHFIENNDLPRFIKKHNLQQTKMAAALLFSLPGIPMIYNGQETGVRSHPYSKNPIFVASQSIKSLDSNNLFNYYQKLIHLRSQYASLRDKNMQEVAVSPVNTIVSFHRWNNNQHVIVIINLDSSSAEATVDLQKTIKEYSPKKYLLKDMLSNDVFQLNKNKRQSKIYMKGYSTRWLLIN